MEKEFIPYQEALELKALGFDEECINEYWFTSKELRFSFENIKNIYHTKRSNSDNNDTSLISAPTFSQAFRWFREKYGWVAEIHGSLQLNHFYANLLLQAKGEVRNIKMCDTYEEAELACLRKLIEIIKNK